MSEGFKVLSLMLTLLLSGCVSLPDDVTPVQGFELPRYLGKWYEIARLDHSFERGLSRVTAQYSMRADGGVQVTNRGFSANDGQWKEAVGKAYFVGDPGTAFLKVSFFGPFYGSYIVFDLDRDNYEYAFVAGPDKSYLWLLSRTPQVEQRIIQRFIDSARNLGVHESALIFVQQ